MTDISIIQLRQSRIHIIFYYYCQKTDRLSYFHRVTHFAASLLCPNREVYYNITK